MKREIVVLDTDAHQCEVLCDFLSSLHFETVRINAIGDLVPYLCTSDCRAVILSLDNIRVNNRTLRDLKRKKPLTSIIALSQRQFHPELEEAFRDYISVCLKQPLDSEELAYWLKSIFENDEAPSA